ncbi:S-layer homology domain-containing protein [Metasolibacillus sp. FSL H7-0170]|uniref:S-layer homology domain-containing protein n=1 Tax=Metasolibacillus sp. FSL H7-0170 TaxID=2921431 RepID=UPI003158817D
MIKKWGSIFIITILIWSQLGGVSPKAADGFEIITNPDDTLIIVGYAGQLPSEDLVIPSVLDGKTVVEIYDGAFAGRALQTLVIPSTVKKIGNGAFGVNQITSLTFEPESELEEIGIEAFQQNALTNITIPSSVKKIGNTAFGNNKLEKIGFNASSTSPIAIDFGVFNNQLGKLDSTWYINGKANEPWDSTLATTIDTAMVVYSTPQISATKPSPPTILIATAGIETATILFQPSVNDGGSAITGYKVKVYENGIEKPALETTTTNLTPNIANTLMVTVPNLTNGQSYTFRMVATNIIGDSVESAGSNPPVIPSMPITPPPITTVPFAPYGIIASAGNGKASVSFGVPMYNGGSPILGYKVKVYVDGIEKPALQTNGSLSPITVPGLTNGTEYTFKVVATNAIGDSANSGESNTVTPNADTLTDEQAVTQAIFALAVGYATGDSSAHVTKDLQLLTSGLFGTTVSWSSNQPLIVKPNGNVIRPSVEDNIVILKATIAKGNTSGTKTFTVTVKGVSAPTTPNVTPPPSTGGGTTNNNNETGNNSNTNSTSEQLVIDVQAGDGHDVAKTIVNRTTNSDGTIQDRVTLTAQSTTEALAKLQEQRSDTMRIILPTDNRAQQTDVVVPPAVLTMLKEGEVLLEIVATDTKITIPQSSLQSFEQELYFRVVPVKTVDAKQQLEERAKTGQAVQQLAGNTIVTLLGQPMTIETNMQNRPVTLTLPLPNDVTQEQLDNLAVYIEHSDGTKEVVRGQIVAFKEGVRGIQFEVTKFSTFSILYMPQEQIDEQPNEEQFVSKPYIRGYADGTFRPNAPVTRAQIASMLARYLTNNEIPEVQASFRDTTKHGAKDAIEYVKEKELFQGTTATTFNPNGTITRAQMAAVVVRWMEQQGEELASNTTLSFTDVKANHWATEQIAKVNALGIMTGTSDTTFNPEGALTRAQAVKVLNQLFEREVQTSTQSPLFIDVTPVHWAFDDIQAAAQ